MRKQIVVEEMIHTCRRLPPVTARRSQRPQLDKKKRQVICQFFELKL